MRVATYYHYHLTPTSTTVSQLRDKALIIFRPRPTATEYHLGLLKAKLARYRAELIDGSKGGGAKVGDHYPSCCHIIAACCIFDITVSTYIFDKTSNIV
jgi:hypothetical protein